MEQVRLLNCINPRTASRPIVTTRISGLVPGVSAEFSLGVLEPTDAVALMFEVSGSRSVPPYEEILGIPIRAGGVVSDTPPIPNSQIPSGM